MGQKYQITCLWSNSQYARKLISKPRLSYSKSASFPHKNIKMWEMLMCISIFEASFLLNLIFNQLLRSAESISVSNLSSFLLPRTHSGGFET